MRHEVKIGLLAFMLLFVVGSCKGLQEGLKDDKTQEKVAEMEKLSKEVINPDKTINVEKLQQLLILTSELSKEIQNNKLNWFELLGYMIGISAGTYIGTRQLRTRLLPAFLSIFLKGYKPEEKKIS